MQVNPRIFRGTRRVDIFGSIALTDGDLVNADSLGPGVAGTAEFLPHVLLFQSVERLAFQM
jgi:hypothetical protein